MPTVKPEQHGTRTAYNYGCRCALCKEAESRYSQAHRGHDGEAHIGELKVWAASLGFDLPANARSIPKPLIDRWNREHPDRPYTRMATRKWFT